MDTSEPIKVRLTLDHNAWHGAASEGIWTKLVKQLADRTIVQVDNIPFFTKSLSLGDTISVVLGQNALILNSIIERGGHSTYRVFVQDPDDEHSNLLETLRDMGCDWEKARFKGGELYAVDLPPQVDIYEVYAVLEKGQKEGSWLFEEGYVGHPLKGDAALPSHKTS